MPFFPTEKFEIETGMTREEVVRRLEQVTRFQKYINNPPDQNTLEGLEIIGQEKEERVIKKETRLFVGEINQDGFLIERNDNIFVFGIFSEISGEFKDGANGTIVSASMQVNFLRKLIYWSGIIMFFLCLALVLNKEPQSALFLTNFMLGLFCIACSIMILRFMGIIVLLFFAFFVRLPSLPVFVFTIYIFAILLFMGMVGLHMRLRAEAQTTGALFRLIFKKMNDGGTLPEDNSIIEE